MKNKKISPYKALTIRYNEAVAGIERLQSKRYELEQEVKRLEKQLETRQEDLERERRRYDRLKNDIARLLALSGHLEDKEDRTNAIKAIVSDIFGFGDSERCFDAPFTIKHTHFTPNK